MVQNNTIPCKYDADCPKSLVCYTSDEADWVPENVTFCLCSTWYGWEPHGFNEDDCDLSIFAILSLVFFSLTGLYYLYELRLVSKDIFQFWFIDPHRQSKLALGLTIIYCFAWLVTGIIRMIFLSIEFGSPQAATLLYYGPEWKYSPYGVYQTKPLLVATSVWQMLTDFNIILVLYFVCRKSMRLVSYDPFEKPTKILTYTIQLIYTIAGFVVILMDSLSFFVYFTIPFKIIAVFGYMFSGLRLSRALIVHHRSFTQHHQKQGENDEGVFLELSQKIRKLSLIMSLLIILSIIAFFVLGFVNARFKNNGFLPASAFIFGVFLESCQLFFITRFIRKTVLNQTKSRQNVTSLKLQKKEYTKTTIADQVDKFHSIMVEQTHQELVIQ